jgi:hypothetical protein
LEDVAPDREPDDAAPLDARLDGRGEGAPWAEAEDAEPAPQSVRKIAIGLRARSTILRCTLAAAGAWVVTLAPLVLAARATPLARAVALLALAPGIAGPQLIARDHRLSRHVGITAYLALAVASWALASRDGTLAAMDVFRGALGALAWGVWGIAWSHPWSVSDVALRTAPPGETAGLKPRRRPPSFAVGVAVGGAVAAALCMALAWTVDDPARGVLAQAVAAAAAIALLTSASAVSVVAGREGREGQTARLPINRRVLNTLVLMLVVGGLAAAVHFSR